MQYTDLLLRAGLSSSCRAVPVRARARAQKLPWRGSPALYLCTDPVTRQLRSEVSSTEYDVHRTDVSRGSDSLVTVYPCIASVTAAIDGIT